MGGKLHSGDSCLRYTMPLVYLASVWREKDLGWRHLFLYEERLHGFEVLTLTKLDGIVCKAQEAKQPENQMRLV
jgi:hypothetical protein